VFGLSFGELIVIVIVALVVFGPEELPKMLRKAGQFAGKMRRMALDLRVKSGIDDVLHAEGIADDLRELRALARGEIDNIASGARIDRTGAGADAGDPYPPITAAAIDREREYPRESPDSYDALPDTAVIYTDALPMSPLASDPVYMQGIAFALTTAAAATTPGESTAAPGPVEPDTLGARDACATRTPNRTRRLIPRPMSP
jgi:sec-independent protein translocase protein TatB